MNTTKSRTLHVDGSLLVSNPSDAGPLARQLEDLGYDGVYTFEGRHDPFLPLAVAAGATSRLKLATGIAVAFARNPMLLANLGYDLQLMSGGRFMLGLGSQIRPHIEKRFSATWSKPVPRMREIVLALRAIWRCWNEDEKLDFRGEFYRHTLMTPLFKPQPSPYGPPRVFLAGVGRPMTAVAGEVGDGLFVHPLNSPTFLRETTLPALEAGFARGGHTRERFEIACQAMVVTGWDDEEMARAEMGTRLQIAFYASTPAYRVVLDAHGWGDLQPELNAMSKQGKWKEMGELIDDDMLDTFAVVAEPSGIAPAFTARFGDVVDRLSFYAPYKNDPDTWLPVIEALQKA